MTREDTILVATVQHTGTWFVLDMLKEHDEISNIIPFGELLEHECIPSPAPGKKNIICTHIAASFEGIHPKELFKFLNPTILTPMVHYYTTVMTVRDPMRSLITRHLRHPDLDHKYIVDGFVYMANCKASGANVFFMPVDWIGEQVNSTRRGTIINMARYCDIGYTPSMEKAADEWFAPPYNVTAKSELKDSYQRGEIDLVRRVLEEELEYLRSKGSVIRFFLESIGYRKLPWWTS